MRLAGADHRPLDVAHRLPPAQPARVGPDPARGLVGGQERLHLPQPADRQLVVAEPPRADHQPGEVLGRVAGVAELPVDHRGEPALVDDHVAEPEVAVDQPRARGRRRRVQAQPPQPGLDRRQRLADRVELRLPQSAGLERRLAGAAGEPLHRRGLDRVDLSERRGELRRQTLARRRQLVAPEHARRHRGPGDELHQVARSRSEPPARRLEGDRRSDRAAGQVGGLDRPQLELQRGE